MKKDWTSCSAPLNIHGLKSSIVAPASRGTRARFTKEVFPEPHGPRTPTTTPSDESSDSTCDANDRAKLARPLASGLLSGKMTAATTFAPDDHRTYNRQGEAFDRGETFSGVDFEVGLAAVEELRPLVPPDATMAQMALRWILMFEEVTCTIPGAKRPSQAEDNVRAADLPPLSESTMESIRAVYDRHLRPQVHGLW